MSLSLCSPHCGVSPETTSGGETYERELLARLARGGMRVERLLGVLRDDGLRTKLAGLARERAERLFRWERCVQGTRRVYEHAVEAWRRAGKGNRR